MQNNALLWLKPGDTFGEGVNKSTLVYREMKNGHFYGLIWNNYLELGSICRLDAFKYYITVFSKEDGINYIKEHDEHHFEYFI